MDGITNNLRLLMDLLEHKVLISALLGSLCIPFDLGKRLLDLLTINVIEGNSALNELGYFHISDVIYITGILKYSGNIGSNICLSVSYSDDHGAVLTSCIYLSGVVLEHYTQSI